MGKWKPTEEQRRRYKENEKAKLAALTPEEREARLAKRRIYEREKRIAGGAERREHDRQIRLAYEHRKKMENPNWSSDKYMKSKCVKARRAAELNKQLKPGEKLCSRCKFIRPEDDFPITRTGDRSTMCSKCYSIVTRDFDTSALTFWKAQAAKINTKAKTRLKKLYPDAWESRYAPVTGEELMALWESQQHKCAYCGIPLNSLIMAYDHKHPLARTGYHGIDNIQLLCHNCNVSKFIMDDDDYRKFIQ